MFMRSLPIVLSGAVCVWALLKAGEVLFLFVAVLLRGNSLAKALAVWRRSGFDPEQYKQIEHEYTYLLTRHKWPFSRAFFLAPTRLRDVLVSLFRFPVVVVLLVVTLPRGPATLSEIGIFIMLALLWSYLLQILASGFKLGHADYLLRRTAIALSLSGPGQAPGRPISATQEFVKIFAGFFGLSLLGYASIYLTLARFYNGPPAFEGKFGHPPTFFDFVYFSITTAGTVGFGDIVPASAEARLFVMSQILLTFALVVFLVVEISLSSSYGDAD
jgi:Ion channel